MSGPILSIRPTVEADLSTLASFHADKEAARMAAFVSEHWHDEAADMAKWKENLVNNETRNYTIIYNGEIAGSVSSYPLFCELQVTYWIGRAFWNKGIATKALREFINLVPERPLYGRVAFDNAGSAKVLTNCGFRQVDVDKYHSNIRDEEIGEVIYKLDQ